MAVRQRLAHLKAAFTGRSAAPLTVRFAGAAHNRLMQGWASYVQSVDDALLYKLPTLRARSRQLVEDNGEAAGLLLDFESDIVGPKGAILQFRATKKRGTPLDALNDRIEAAFKAWGRMGVCTRDGTHDFASLQRLMLRTVIVDGEFVAIRHRDPSLAHGYALQLLDADQLDADYNRPPDANGVSIVMGVEVDRYGARVGYWIWQRHPSSVSKGERVRYDAADVLHVFKQLRPGQTRGVPWFAPALVTWKLGEQYTESELVQSMLAAAQGGFFENADGGVSFPTEMVRNPETGRDEPKPIVINAEPGMSRALPPGWTFKAWQPTHPTANYVGFMKAVKRTIARAFGRSYASLTGDLSDVNFSSMRTDRVRETEQNKVLQADVLVRQFCAVVFADWLPMASLKGVLGVLPDAPSALTVFADWMCKGWPWVDPFKDAMTAQLEIQMRISSPQIVCAERGRDFFDVVDQIAEAEAYAKSKQVTMDAVLMNVTIVEAPDAPDDDQDTDDTPTKDAARARPPLRIAAGGR